MTRFDPCSTSSCTNTFREKNRLLPGVEKVRFPHSLQNLFYCPVVEMSPFLGAHLYRNLSYVALLTETSGLQNAVHSCKTWRKWNNIQSSRNVYFTHNNTISLQCSYLFFLLSLTFTTCFGLNRPSSTILTITHSLHMYFNITTF
jgi:hypothetical protein